MKRCPTSLLNKYKSKLQCGITTYQSEQPSSLFNLFVSCACMHIFSDYSAWAHSLSSIVKISRPPYFKYYFYPIFSLLSIKTPKGPVFSLSTAGRRSLSSSLQFPSTLYHCFNLDILFWLLFQFIYLLFCYIYYATKLFCSSRFSFVFRDSSSSVKFLILLSLLKNLILIYLSLIS